MQQKLFAAQLDQRICSSNPGVVPCSRLAIFLSLDVFGASIKFRRHCKASINSSLSPLLFLQIMQRNRGRKTQRAENCCSNTQLQVFDR